MFVWWHKQSALNDVLTCLFGPFLSNVFCGVIQTHLCFIALLLQGHVPEMVLNAAGMLPAETNALISTPIQSTQISGTFTVTMPVFYHEGHHAVVQAQRTTGPISAGATAAEMQHHLTRYLWNQTKVVVTRSRHSRYTDAANDGRPLPLQGSIHDEQDGYEWRVTFVHSKQWGARQAFYDFPQMSGDATNLQGFGARVDCNTPIPGLSELGGTFDIYFRETGPSSAVPYNASTAEMKAALMSLGSIDDVTVTRTGPTLARGYVDGKREEG